MDSAGRLPEDLAAEQAYLAELRAEQDAAARNAAAAHRARLAAQGLVEPLAPPAVPAKPAVPGGLDQALRISHAPSASPAGISPETLLKLNPELLRQLPPEVQQAVAAARRDKAQQELRQPAGPSATAAAGTPPQQEAGPAGGIGLADPPASEAELARREALVLAQVQAELAEGSVLVRPPGKDGLITKGVRAVDGVLSKLFGRRSTW